MLVRLVLLQHGNELGRDTATGPLLSDERMRSHASVQAWTWHSCDDNERIGELIASLVSPALLWAAEGKAAASAPQAAELAAPTYVLLDGTWQEAEEVFSRGPSSLRAMARVTLPAAPSTFWLRSPFAGKARFGEAGSDGQGLVCTAEAAAALLELQGDADGGAQLRRLLGDFQETYATEHPRLYRAKLDLQRRRRDPEVRRAAEERRDVRAWRAATGRRRVDTDPKPTR